MHRMEVITRVERRRQYSDEERAAGLAQCSEPGATVVGVSRRLGISLSLIHTWRKTQREAERLSAEPMQFISYGMLPEEDVPARCQVAPTPLDGTPPSVAVPVEKGRPTPQHLFGTSPHVRPGTIKIALPSGVQLSVDSFVNEKALARVLRALEHIA